MARLKKPCVKFFMNNACQFGVHCNYSHDLEKAATSAKPFLGSKRCNTYWDTGHCKHDLGCRYPHIPNPAHKTSKVDAVDVDWRKSTGQAIATVQAIDASFPAYSTVEGRSSDSLLCASKLLTSNKVKKVLHDAGQEGVRITSVAMAEDMLLAINAANNNNEHWTFEERQSLLQEIAKTPGDLILRLDEIMRWDPVAHSASGRESMSFQATFMGIIAYYTSESVLKSASHTHLSALYGLIDSNLKHVISVIEDNISACLQDRSFKDASRVPYGRTKIINIVTGLQIFRPIAVLFSEYMARFRSASTAHPELVTFVHTFQEQFEAWEDLLLRHKFDDALIDRAAADQDFFIKRTKEEIKKLRSSADKSLPLTAKAELPDVRLFAPSLGVLAYIEREYDGPGYLSEEGPRHDNDKADIAEISIPPTTDELMSHAEPYLPVNLVGAKHHLPWDSIEKIRDIYFRLLRADSTASLAAGIRAVLDDLDDDDYDNTQIAQLIRTGGGRFSGTSDRSASISMPLIANLQFSGLVLDHQHGLVVHVRGDAPPGAARSALAGQRRYFWEQGKRLPMGGLVAIVTKERRMPATVSLAILTTYPSNFKHIERPGRSGIEFGLSFVDAADGLRAAEKLRHRDESKGDIRVLLESPVLYEAVRPFLQALQQIDPVNLPLSDYIRHGDLRIKEIQLPGYSIEPGFTWNLKSLLKPQDIVQSCNMDPSNTVSIAAARRFLYEHGKLDKSQTDAVIDCLTREMALIQGPPGTGKTFTGVELLRLLIENGQGPIILLAFTNHALDHILRAIHDNDVTRNMLRLGSRSKDEIVSQYSLEAIERVAKKDTSLHVETSKFHRVMKDLEADMKKVSDAITQRVASAHQILTYLEINHPELAASIKNPPDFAGELYAHSSELDGWETQSKSKAELTLWSFWRDALDLDHLRYLENKPIELKIDPIAPTINKFSNLALDADSDESSDSDDDERDRTYDFMFEEGPVVSWDEMTDSSSETASIVHVPDTPAVELQRTKADIMQEKAAFLDYFGLPVLPHIPQTRRSLGVLLADGDAWMFSAEERARVAEYVAGEAKADIDEDSLTRFETLHKKHAEARKRYAEAKDNIRVKLLSGIKLLGSTTTGAAKLQTVLRGFSPKILVIEEAGQVLEAHVLATLFPTVQHVIAIGDPQQLRPSLNCYDLSVDSPKGHDLYRFDVSLMERLSSGGLAMSQLQVQRRMRPAISSLLRNTLYSRLEDHPVVGRYPDVRGMGKNLFFLDHRHRESKSEDDGSSKHNAYEVKMACDLAVYLLKQGAYSQEGDIVILCAYLGQLKKVRDALKGQVMVIMDERDQRELDKRGEDAVEDNTEVKEVSVGSHVLLRTVDNFQGEEAKVVIVSLVRNAGDLEDDVGIPTTIGFLNSNNRVNVALSRAKHGMYIMGNAEQLASKSPMWETVIDELTETDAIGDGWPIACARHPETLRFAKHPGQIQMLSPDGGCMLQCNMPMGCGHTCLQKCHPDDLEHTLIQCHRPCTKLLPQCRHACTKTCCEECGPCEVICTDVELSCGHLVDLRCEQTMRLELVECPINVIKPFETCEHQTVVQCGDDINKHICRVSCGKPRDCCGRDCTQSCSDCQLLNGPQPDCGDAQAPPPRIHRVKHAQHPCEKLLDVCGHQCSGKCESDHTHPPCSARCLQQCDHKTCTKTCKTPCEPCKELCQWRCKHLTCTMPCAMPCDRLPCDEPCEETLICGHQCRSVCGEPCASQICPDCAAPDQLNQVVDFIMQSTLAEVCAEEPETRFITLGCGHIFTVETLDGHIDLKDCYESDEDGKLVGIRTPDSGAFKPRPTCPTCRGPITSPRYNRVTKRALLDIQEQHAIHNYARDLVRAREGIRRFDLDAAVRSVQRNIATIDRAQVKGHPAVPTVINSHLRLYDREKRCITQELFVEKLGEVLRIAGPLSDAWRRTIDIPAKIYKSLARTVNAGQLPHVKAYESAITQLYRQELELATAAGQGDHTHQAVVDRAMLLARRRVGAPFPKGEARFKIEALVETIKIRLHLASIAQEFVRVLEAPRLLLPGDNVWTANVTNTESSHAAGRFRLLHSVILRSAKRDADLARRFCSKAGTKMLTLTVEIVALQADFDECRQLHLGQLAAQNTKPGIGTEVAEAAKTRLDQAMSRFDATFANVADTERLLERATTTVRPAAEIIFEEWGRFIESLKSSTTYSPVSDEEKQQVVAAVLEADYGFSGRFYQCPEGHTFTIGECGQAMAEARCPDCGRAIGGGHHQLRADNTRDVEYERIANRLGGRRNPHADF